MRTTVSLAALALLCAPLAAQHVRPVTQVDTTTTGFALGPSMSSDGETSAVVYFDGGTGGANIVYVVTSDGRGLTWSAPVRIDSAPVSTTVKFTQSDSCWVYGDNVYAVWRDDRNDDASTTSIRENDMFLNVSRDGGATWLGDAIVPKGYPAGDLSRTIRDFAIYVHDNGTAAGTDDHVYVLQSVEGPSGGNEELYLAASHDGGASFGAAVYVPVNPVGAADVDFIALAAAGTTVHVAWQDNRNGGTSFDDVWYQRSTDGGATWQPADLRLNDISVLQGDAEFEMSLAASGSTVVAAWQEERTSTSNEEIRVAVSTDGGATWSSDVHPGSGTAGLGDADFAVGGLAHVNGRILVAWNDDAGFAAGEDKVYVTTSGDNGATWSADVMVSDLVAGGGFASFGRPRAGQDCVALTWSSDVFPNNASCAWSRDGGATWTANVPVVVSNNTGDVDFAEVTYNTLYNNVIAGFLADDLGNNRLYVGGFRPQTLTAPATVTAGQVISFSVSNFCSAENGTRFAVLAAGNTGGHTLADGRATGLANDAFLAQSIGIVQAAVLGGQQTGVLNGLINNAGAGMTANLPFPNTVPVGTNLRLVAVGFDLPPLTLGSITDVEVMAVQ